MELFIDKECRDRLISGVNKLANAVVKTYGPQGQTVIIPSKKNINEYDITKDGVSVAESVVLADVMENIAADFVKAAARLTVKEAGDGTTTATYLAQCLINALKDFNFKEVQAKLDTMFHFISLHLQEASFPLTNENLKKVALVSSNGDETISKFVSDAYNFSKTVIAEQSNQNKDSLELINGIKFKVPYMSPNYINDFEKSIVCYEDIQVLIVDGKIDDTKAITPLLQKYKTLDIPLLIITEGLSENVSRFIDTNVLNNGLKVTVMKSPGFSTHRKNLLKDIAKYTDAKVFKYPLTLTDFKPQDFDEFGRAVKGLGVLKSVKSNSIETIITGNSKIAETSDFQDYLKYLDNLYEETKKMSETLSIDLIEQRVNNFKNSLAIIRVGGNSESEMIERFDRYEDAIRAVDCALVEGIVTGGGYTLKRAAESTSELLKDNTGVYDAIRGALGAPYYFLGGDSIDRKDVFDPLTVSRSSLKNAITVTKTILSTGAAVIAKHQWKI